MILNTDTKKWESPYWHPAVTVDAVVVGYDEVTKALSILLVERGVEPFKGSWALPGGFICQQDESAEAAVLRELREETQVEGVYLRQFQTFSRIDRDPRPDERVITIAFYALVKQSRFMKIKGGDDAKNAKWFPLEQLPDLAFDHQEIIEAALKRLRRDIHFEPIGFQLLDKEFTLHQLHNIYRAILLPSETTIESMCAEDIDVEPERRKIDSRVRAPHELKNKSDMLNDRRNFLKKMLKEGYIRDTGKKVTGVPNRPPSLYTFNEDSFDDAEEKMRTKL